MDLGSGRVRSGLRAFDGSIGPLLNRYRTEFTADRFEHDLADGLARFRGASAKLGVQLFGNVLHLQRTHVHDVSMLFSMPSSMPRQSVRQDVVLKRFIAASMPSRTMASTASAACSMVTSISTRSDFENLLST